VFLSSWFCSSVVEFLRHSHDNYISMNRNTHGAQINPCCPSDQ
jgi:hypothetical protein